MDVSGAVMEENENTDLGTAEYAEASEAQKNAAIKVAVAPELDTGMHKVVIIAKLSRYDKLIGTSLVVQWLRLCTSNAGCIQSLFRE